MWFRLRTLKKSFHYAWKGICYTFRHEQNFRIQLAISLIVVILMKFFSIKQWEAVALIFVIAAVLVLEIFNTVLERFIDVLKPRLHYDSKIIKDMMAAAVLISSIGAFLVGAIIFSPYLSTLLFEGML